MVTAHRAEPDRLPHLVPLLLSSIATALVGYQLGRAGRRFRTKRFQAVTAHTAIDAPEVRNAGLTYRPVGDVGEPYPSWVRALHGQSGVYVIRETRRDGETEIVYVGESHSDRLYQTLTRHFQTWRRSKKFWSGMYGGQGHDPGLTYPRNRVTVAVRVMSGNRAIEEEARLIARLRPRDNLVGQPDGFAEEAPF